MIKFALELFIHEVTKKSRVGDDQDNEDLDESRVVKEKKYQNLHQSTKEPAR